MAVLRCTMSLAFVLLLQALTLTTAFKTRQSAIISHLIANSDPNTIPLPDNDRPLQVNLDFQIAKILEVDCYRNEIDVVVWQRQSWNNPALAWNVTKEGFNESDVSFPSEYLWVPDITVYNYASTPEIVSPPEAHVYSDGSISIMQQIRVRVWCDLQNVDSISGARCWLACGSWTNPNKTLSLSNRVSRIASSGIVANPNYDILGASGTKRSQEYSCCPGETFDYIVFSFTVRKRDNAVRVPEEKNGSGK